MSPNRGLPLPTRLGRLRIWFKLNGNFLAVDDDCRRVGYRVWSARARHEQSHGKCDNRSIFEPRLDSNRCSESLPGPEEFESKVGSCAMRIIRFGLGWVEVASLKSGRAHYKQCRMNSF